MRTGAHLEGPDGNFNPQGEKSTRLSLYCLCTAILAIDDPGLNVKNTERKVWPLFILRNRFRSCWRSTVSGLGLNSRKWVVPEQS
jgi:hypothetical protein